ncbi:MAG TPA: urate hydroxylase PuuD [Paracoccaceae bacterium]|nr:urate hydroxylase PuuD [Paracoccaceae bacterium]
MEAIFHDWIGLVARWAHIVAAIGWIGSSFYFMWLDHSLRDDGTLPKGVKGESWSVHGGGFYQVRKFQVAPERMPAVLHWFKWEAYSTWLTGLLMLAVVYWWGAEGMLIDRTVLDLSVSQAVVASAASLGLGWLLYDRLCKSGLRDSPVAMFAVLYAAIVLLAWGFGHVFSARAAWLHTGAVIATIMSGNVFFTIIPNQRKTVAAMTAGEAPDPRLGAEAKLRSTHNNYLTLPVIALMISNHYPVAFGHPHSWVLIALILAIGAAVRNWFNLHDQDVKGPRLAWQWPTAAVLFVALMGFSAWRPDAVAATLEPARAMAVVEAHCAACHAASPRHADFVEAPGGVAFDTLEEMRAQADAMLAQAVLSKAMPLGDETGITAEERAILGAWLRAGAPAP